MNEPVTQAFFVPGPLPGLNDIVAARGRRGQLYNSKGKRWDPYNQMKQQWTMIVRSAAMGMMAMERAWICFLHLEPNKRRDPDNFSAGASKVILDSLVETCLLPGDGWRHILSPTVHLWLHAAKRPGVVLGLSDQSIQQAETAAEEHLWRMQIPTRPRLVKSAQSNS